MSTVNKMVQYFSEHSKNNNLVYDDIVEKILTPEYDNIPEEWLRQIAKREYIEELCRKKFN